MTDNSENAETVTSGAKTVAPVKEPASAILEPKVAPASVPVQRNEKIDFSFLREPETSMQKMKRKLRENPLVPIGMGLTTAALVLGLFNFSTGNKRMQQLMMRARVVAQGGTVVALIGGLYLAATKHNAERRKKYANT